MVHIRNITDAELCMRFLFWTWKDEYCIQSLLLCGRRSGLSAPGRTGNIQPKKSVDQSGNGCGIGYPVFPHRRKYDYHAACIRIVPDLCARKKSGGDIVESVYQICQFHQYGDLPLSYDVVPCD